MINGFLLVWFGGVTVLYYIYNNGKRGPFTLEELQGLYTQGALPGGVLVQSEETGQYLSLEKLMETQEEEVKEPPEKITNIVVRWLVGIFCYLLFTMTYIYGPIVTGRTARCHYNNSWNRSFGAGIAAILFLFFAMGFYFEITEKKNEKRYGTAVASALAALGYLMLIVIYFMIMFKIGPYEGLPFYENCPR